MEALHFDVIVVGGGHAGVEAAWGAANLLGPERAGRVALVTLDPARMGQMSCNPAIGGLAKGQLVREIDALGGLMGIAADDTGIHFKMLNRSKGAAVWGPRCQSDNIAYARRVRALIDERSEIKVIAGAVDRLLVEEGQIRGVEVSLAGEGRPLQALLASAVVLTTGTFMRGLMHQGQRKTPGGRVGEAAVSTISQALAELGFELGRLKTGTPPRLRRSTIDWEGLPTDEGDAVPSPFSVLTDGTRFPAMEQVSCRQTHTTLAGHEAVRANLHRAPMFSGQLESVGPRYCPSIEDKVVRFADRDQHGVFLEPESHESDIIYCNGIATSLPTDVQDEIVRTMPGCERAEIVRHGYAVEYDMVRPHQIRATGETKQVHGLFLAGQINGTSGYEEAAAQGLVAGVNAALRSIGGEPWVLGRHEAYIGVLFDDLVTKTPVEPYRMFTSRAEHRLLLRSDNASDRLTPIAQNLGLLATTERGHRRAALWDIRHQHLAAVTDAMNEARLEGRSLTDVLRRTESTVDTLRGGVAVHPAVMRVGGPNAIDDSVWFTAFANAKYAAYIERQRVEVRRQSTMEHQPVPAWLHEAPLATVRTEARQAVHRFRPETFGQLRRLEGITPADVTLLSVLAKRGPGASVVSD